MQSAEIRTKFLEFFKEKSHTIVSSAPIVVKNDPTLMFTNAGMNQFKDIFLGNSPVTSPRITNTQKCLRVSGKHNDLEEVGVDTYHHTMFEMLGNWSFGDYFKKEAIEWAWELLTEVYKIPKDKLYVTVFEGSADDNLEFDQESYDYWKQFLPEDRILRGNKKDNFWEMGDTGPCGPCSEIHADIRDESEKLITPGHLLVNEGHPQVIEIWNNVFIQYNRLQNKSLVPLPSKHVDTGMGFERLCMVLQGKKSNYDTDVFQTIIQYLAGKSGIPYQSSDSKTDISMRVVSDHIRAIAFTIADGQLPSNNKAGYVIRRILRRAVRYAYSFLGFKDPFLYELVPILAAKMGAYFPELEKQKDLIMKVVKEEESSFLRTLGNGITRFEDYLTSKNPAVIDGTFAFELYDTFGFPIDLTELLAREKNLSVDMKAFHLNLEQQKARARAASTVEAADWIIVHDEDETEFVGYNFLESDSRILKYRKIVVKGKEQFQLVLDSTPFYAESGGQKGDTGVLENETETIHITDTKKENNLIVHFSDKIPTDVSALFRAKVNAPKRNLIINNHSATHLMHAALRQVLGTHVEQRGSYLDDEFLRFDFSHFAKVSDEEIAQIEAIVNGKIRENIKCETFLMPLEDARNMGAMALFGEKYSELVRVVTFDPTYSIELCGGVHVPATGQIGAFKIISEGAVASGIRRIEAITAKKADEYFEQKLKMLDEISKMLNHPKDILKGLEQVIAQKDGLELKVNAMLSTKANEIKNNIASIIKPHGDVNFAALIIHLDSADHIKNICFELKNQVDNLFLVVGAEVGGKPQLFVTVSESLVKSRNMNAGSISRDLAKEIKGGGGGQAFYATAGGTDSNGLSKAVERAKGFIR